MERKIRSMRGEMVNFDLFAIKEQMSEAPANATIKQREKFIDMRKRRGGRKVLNDIVPEEQPEAVALPQAAIQPASEPSTVEAENATPTDKIRRKIVKKDDQ